MQGTPFYDFRKLNLNQSYKQNGVFRLIMSVGEAFIHRFLFRICAPTFFSCVASRGSVMFVSYKKNPLKPFKTGLCQWEGLDFLWILVIVYFQYMTLP